MLLGCHVVRLLCCWVVSLLGCCIIGMLTHWVVGLLGCWVVGLLGDWVIGLSDCQIINYVVVFLSCCVVISCDWTSQEESCQQNRTTPRHLLKQGTSFHTQMLNLSGQPTETYNSKCISNQTNNWSIWTQMACTPKHASKLSLQESTSASAKDCLNWQQSRKQTRTYHWTKSTHNISKLSNMQD